MLCCNRLRVLGGGGFPPSSTRYVFIHHNCMPLNLFSLSRRLHFVSLCSSLSPHPFLRLALPGSAVKRKYFLHTVAYSYSSLTHLICCGCLSNGLGWRPYSIKSIEVTVLSFGTPYSIKLHWIEMLHKRSFIVLYQFLLKLWYWKHKISPHT